MFQENKLIQTNSNQPLAIQAYTVIEKNCVLCSAFMRRGKVFPMAAVTTVRRVKSYGIWSWYNDMI